MRATVNLILECLRTEHLLVGCDGVTIFVEPVARAVEAPSVNLLLADDVGLGKTIEAGLVMQEMLLRHRARRMVVVCPAPLTLNAEC